MIVFDLVFGAVILLGIVGAIVRAARRDSRPEPAPLESGEPREAVRAAIERRST